MLFLSLCGALLLRGQITGRSCSGLPRTVRAGCDSFLSPVGVNIVPLGGIVCQHLFSRFAQPGKSKKPAAGIRCSTGAPIRAETGTKHAADGCAALGGLDALGRAFRPALRRLLRHCPRGPLGCAASPSRCPQRRPRQQGRVPAFCQNRLHLPRPVAFVLAASPSSAAVA